MWQAFDSSASDMHHRGGCSDPGLINGRSSGYDVSSSRGSKIGLDPEGKTKLGKQRMQGGNWQNVCVPLDLMGWRRPSHRHTLTI